jgi:hypothetical protein
MKQSNQQINLDIWSSRIEIPLVDLDLQSVFTFFLTICYFFVVQIGKTVREGERRERDLLSPLTTADLIGLLARPRSDEASEAIEPTGKERTGRLHR